MKLEIARRGDIYIRLFTKEAPKATGHIIGLVDKGFYNGKDLPSVDRTPKPYLARVGPPNSTDAADVRIPFEDTGYSFDQVGMVGLCAKAKDRNSGDSQFHILLAPAKFLDGNYTCFGKVVAGIEVLNSLNQGDVVTRATILRG